MALSNYIYLSQNRRVEFRVIFIILDLISMNKEIELQERLLEKKNIKEVDKSSSSKIDAKWLANLFHPDNIKDKESNKLVESIGGYEGIQKILKTNIITGTSGTQEDKNWRSKKYGKNDPIVKDSKTLTEMFLENFEDQTIKILCFAAVVSLVLGTATHGLESGWLEGVSIILAVVIVTVVTTANNYYKDQQFKKLKEESSRKNVNVTRNGETLNMNVNELMVGDLVQVETGQIISVDGIVLKAKKISIDESAMTGESDQIKKEDFKNNTNVNCFLISGTKVIEGTAMMIVLTVGKHTVEGQLKLKLQQDDDETPLQEKLAILADQIGYYGMMAATITFGILLLHFLYDVAMGHHGSLFSMETLNVLVQYFIIAVSLVVLAVPEGLPLAVTISLAYSVGKMKQKNNLVKFLAACETMGGANNICTDKTGTLTRNQMTVTKLWAEFKTLDKFTREDSTLSENTKYFLGLNASLNSDANPRLKGGKFEQIGNKTECALIELSHNFGIDYKKIRKDFKDEEIFDTIPFSSSRKKMSCICKVNNKYYIFSKGAPEFLIDNCTKMVSKSGEVVNIDEQFIATLKSITTSFARESLRTILLGYHEITREQALDKQHFEKLQNNLIFLGLAGIKDPLKDHVPEAVMSCKNAGIIVRMVTGDNTQTAIAIAKQAQILKKDYERPEKGMPGYYIAMEGKQFRTLVEGLIKVQGEDKEEIRNIEMFKTITDELRVLARSSPEDKYILATGLKQLNNVVAMTGDGTNDAPALKKADIGFAMNIAGTEVAKEAAGIVLIDDNFSSIITAVLYGRNIFDCIRKFLQFQLTVNVVAIFMAILGATLIKESPLSPVQMLWVNLIMDTLAALALATEPPSDQLLNRMPYSRTEYIITPQMWRGIFLNAFFQIIVLTIILFKGPQLFEVPTSIGITKETWNAENGKHLSIFFNVFVFLQVFNFFNARKLKKDEINVFEEIGDNYLFIAIVIVIFVGQIFIIQYGGKALMVVPLSTNQHLVCIIIGSLSLVFGVFNKKCVPESFLNSFDMLREDNVVARYDVDSVFDKYYSHAATNLRKSGSRK